MAAAVTRSRRGSTGRITRVTAVVFAALAGAGLSLAGTAQAAPARHGPAAAIASGASHASAADATGKPPRCFYTVPDCASSDPTASFNIVSNGDTTGCEFQYTVNWGDKKTDMPPPFPGGADGTVLHTFTHTYADPGSYPITVTGTTTTGSCSAGSGTLQFTFVTAGIYRDFNDPGDVTKAAHDGWGLIANVAGKACIRHRGSKCVVRACASESWVTSTGSDAGVEQVLSTQPGEPFYPAWISYWTPAVPPVGTSLNLAGYAAGLKAGEEIETAVGAAGRPAPLYVGLDFEGSPAAISCGTKVKDPNSRHTRHKDGEKQCWDYDSTATTPQNCFIVRPRGWKAFALGWAAGVESYTTGGGYPASLTAAIYLNKTEYRDDHAGDWGLPVIVAIAPVLGGHAITGPGIVGYAAYGTEEHPATCKDAPADIDHVRDWGGISTIQFSRIGDDGKLVQSIPCTPGGKPG